MSSMIAFTDAPEFTMVVALAVIAGIGVMLYRVIRRAVHRG